MNRKQVFQIFIFTILPLVLGSLVYLLSRSNSTYFVNFLSLKNEKIFLPEFIRFNMIDGLWAFSISSLLNIIWNWEYKKPLLFWLLSLITISTIFEIALGTFDIIDLFLILTGILFPIFLSNIFNLKTLNYEKKTN